MYEFAGAGPCPFPGQLQYRVVNPSGAGVFFEKNFQTPVGPVLRPGQIVCGTPRTDPSGMSSYVVELGNGYANALDFEQLSSAAPSPVLASGALYQLDYVGAGPCPYPGQLQYRVVNPRGAGVFFEKSFQTPVGSALHLGQIVCGTPRTDPSGMSSYVIELGNGYANALDFEQLTSAAPSPMLASGHYVGDIPPGQHVPPPTGCPVGTTWSDSYGKCIPTIPAPMPPPIPLTSGGYVGQGGDIPPDLYGVDAIKKGCVPGTYWDGWYQKCLPVGTRPIVPSPLPPSLEDWRKQHATSGEFWTGADIDAIVGAAVSDGAMAADNAALQAQSAQLAAAHPDAKGTTAAQSALAAASHATQAASHAQAAATHPSPAGAVAHAQKATMHAQQAAAHAADAHAACGNHEAVGAFVTGAAAGAQHQPPEKKAAAHAENATKQAASAHAAASHPAAQNPPAAHEAAHAASAHAAQAQRHAQAARSQPTAHAAEHHARAAQRHTQAAAAHAMRAHAEARGRGFGRGLGRGREGFGRGREGFGRGREGFGRGRVARGHEWYRRPEFAEYTRRYGEGWWRRPEFAEWGRRYGGLGRWGRGRWGWGRHPQWESGIASQWAQYSAQCVQRDDDSGICVKEMIVWPTGQTTFRITPAGEQLEIALSDGEQGANVQVQQETGIAVPDADAGLLPGSEQTADGSAAETADQAVAEEDATDQAAVADQADQATADANQATADATAATNGDDTSTQGDFAGWQMQFTDPYGYFNMAASPAWDSAYPYLPPDYPGWW